MSSDTIQIPLNAPRWQANNLTELQIEKLLKKLWRQGLRIAKITKKPANENQEVT